MLKIENSFAPFFNIFIITVASFSLIIGSVLGLKQSKLKRLLTYSTISHLAYIIIPLSYLNLTNLSSLLFYIAQYTLTNLNIFFIIIAMGYVLKQYKDDNQRDFGNTDVNYISELTMVMKSNTTLALAFAICLFSLSGIPPLAGF
jgi:NADH-ubiquinone oxidoreductase chain 2